MQRPHAATIAASPASRGARPPRELWILAGALVALAAAATPAVFIALGPLRRTLTADDPMIRATAENTLLALRVASLLGAALVGVAIARWSSVANSAWVRAIDGIRVPEEESWRLSLILSPSLAIASGAFALGVLYAGFGERVLPMEWVREINREDGLLEAGTPLLFLVCSILSALTVLRIVRAREQASGAGLRAAVWHGLLAAFFFLCAGEEISWGQRIFGIETAEVMRGINVQNENNLHNVLGYLADSLFIAGVAFYGGILPILAHFEPFVRKTIIWIGIPLAGLGLAIGFLLVSMLHDWTVYRVFPDSHLRVAELREFLSALCFLLLAWETGRRWRRPSTT